MAMGRVNMHLLPTSLANVLYGLNSMNRQPNYHPYYHRLSHSIELADLGIYHLTQIVHHHPNPNNHTGLSMNYPTSSGIRQELCHSDYFQIHHHRYLPIVSGQLVNGQLYLASHLHHYQCSQNIRRL